MDLLAARHAKVAVDGICYGQRDVPVVTDADAASDILLEQLARRATRVARVWASPWSRTREPALRVAQRLGVPLAVDARISELAFGRWEGKPYADLEREADFVAWMANWTTAAPPGGERVADLVARVRAWRQEVQVRQEAVFALTHAGVVRVLRAEARGVGYEGVADTPVPPLEAELFEL